MSSNDQLFASILLASGLSMSADHRAQLMALTNIVSSTETPIIITTIIPTPTTTATAVATATATAAPKKIKPKAKAAAAPTSMSLPPPPKQEEALLEPVGLVAVSNSSAPTVATNSSVPTVTTNSSAPTVATNSSVPTVATNSSAPTVATSANTSQYPNDALRNHRYRIAVPNPKFCMARRWNGDAPIPGTEPAAEGSNGKMFPELQCTRLPVAGGLLCANCTKTETEYSADPENPTPLAKRTWRGRLDGPLFASAAFVGTDLFFKKYPQGLPGDPTTAASPEWLAANTKTKGKPKAATATVPTTTAATTATTAVAASTVIVPVTKTVSPAVKEEWVLALIDDSSYIYERSTLKCYEADMSITTSTKDMARTDRYVGKYEPATNSVNIYGTESDTE